MVIAMSLGAGLGAGLVLLVLALRGAPPPSLARQLARIETPPTTTAATLNPAGAAGRGAPADGGPGGGGLHRVAALLLARLPALTGEQLRADLALMGIDPDAYQLRKMVRVLAALLAGPPVLMLAARLLGVPVLVGTWCALALAGAVFLLPDRRIRRAAGRRRVAFMASYASYLDLVALRASASSGIHEALRDAAAIGDGPGWSRLRRALDSARLNGAPPAEALSRLGFALNLPELVELSGQLYTLNDTGAQAEATFRSKAAALRERQRNDAAGAAAERTESLFLGQLFLAVGFLIALLWAALRSMYGFLP